MYQLERLDWRETRPGMFGTVVRINGNLKRLGKFSSFGKVFDTLHLETLRRKIILQAGLTDQI